jgi:hypothetical protein
MIKDNPLLRYVEENATSGSLREQFYNFIRGNHGELPLDNRECQEVIVQATKRYFEIREE